jgi:hypothetical protein
MNPTPQTPKSRNTPLLQSDVFQPKENSRLFNAYLKIKYEVFVCEKRQSSLPHDISLGRSLPDAFDYNSTIVTVRWDGHGVIGCLRITAILEEDEFPHRQRFEHHIKSASIKRLQAFKVTAVAVKKEYREQKFLDHRSKKMMTAQEALMTTAITTIRRLGGDVTFLSSSPNDSLPFFLRLGFYVIDEPLKLGDSNIVNMALLTNDAEALKTLRSPLPLPKPNNKMNLKELVAREYFINRHRKVSRTLIERKQAC